MVYLPIFLHTFGPFGTVGISRFLVCYANIKIIEMQNAEYLELKIKVFRKQSNNKHEHPYGQRMASKWLA